MTLEVFTLSPWSGTGDPAQGWLVDGLGRLIAELRERLHKGPRPERVALVMIEPPARSAEEQSVIAGAAEALRGMAQALTLELAPHTRVNAVLCGREHRPDDALALLEAREGGFLAGATLDLRRSA